jgi:predicted glutamine amidotransferase
MCVIAVQPKGNIISKEYLQNCWDNNGHGGGLMYAHDKKIIVKKEMKSFEKFYEYITEASKFDSAVVIHFRIATSGGINEYNCHPFKVHKNLYFCHNGILDIKVPATSKENDTQIFNNILMKPLPYNFYKNDAIMNMIEYTIGNGNKFVFLDDNGDFFILNERAGEWSEDGAWFSNTSYKKAKVVYNYNYKPYSGAWADTWYGSDNQVSNSKTTYKYNKDEFEVEEVVGSGEGFDYSICDCCNEWKEVTEVKYVRDWNTYMCDDCEFEMYEYGDINVVPKESNDNDKEYVYTELF